MAEGQQPDRGHLDSSSFLTRVRAGTQNPGHDSDSGSPGEAIAGRLFCAGLDLHFALMVTGDSPAASRLHRAITELDQAILEVRHMILGLARPAATPPLPRQPAGPWAQQTLIT
jgi:hypothetical protein